MAAPDSAALERASQSTGNGSKEGSKLWGEILSANGSVVVWLVFLAFGGALLSLYHSRIQYFPDLKWEDSLTYLAALSLLGGGVAVLYGLHLFLPGAMWSEFLIHDEELRDKLCYDASKTEPCFWSVGIFMGIPYFLFMFIMHFAALPGKLWLTMVVAAILLAVLSWVLWNLFGEYLDRREKISPECQYAKERNEEKKKQEGHLDRNELARIGGRHTGDGEREKESETSKKSTVWRRILDFSEIKSRGTRLLRYVIAFDVSALASLFSTIILYSLVDSENKLGPKSAMIYICTGLVTLSNFWVAVRLRNRPGQAFLTALLATLVLLACGETVDGGKAALSTGIMKKFGLGAEAQRVTLVVDPKRRALFERLKLYPPGQAEDVIPDVLILSRLGEEYCVDAMKREWVKYERVRYVEVARGGPKKRVVIECGEKERLVKEKRVVIPREYVLSWTVPPPLEIRIDTSRCPGEGMSRSRESPGIASTVIDFFAQLAARRTV